MVDSSNSKVTNFLLYGETSKEKLLLGISKKEIVKRKLPAFIVYIIILPLCQGTNHPKTQSYNNISNIPFLIVFYFSLFS